MELKKQRNDGCPCSPGKFNLYESDKSPAVKITTRPGLSIKRMTELHWREIGFRFEKLTERL
jgi:hypothetical protein